MKKNIFLLILLIGFGLNALPQARVFNSTDYKITIGNKVEKVIVNPKSSSFVHFLPSSGEAEFVLGKYEGMKEEVVGVVSRNVIKGKIAIKDFSLKDEVAKKPSESKDTVVISGKSEPFALNVAVDKEWWSEVNIIPKNESSFRLTVLAEPFLGLSLKSGQASNKSAILKTGPCSFPVYYDLEPDSLSTGRKYNWAVVDKIVVENQDTLIISDNDLRQISLGVEVQKMVKNNLSSDFLIVNGLNQGKVIPAGNILKLQLTVGWNVIPVQYINEHGYPVQAVLLLLANELKKPLIFNKKSESNLVSIDPGNLVITGR